MKDKSYVIIRGAERQILTTNMHAIKQPDFKPKIEARSYDHREGDIGMLYPEVTDFFRKFSPKKPRPDSGILRTVTAYEIGNSLYSIGTGIKSDELPVIVYDEKIGLGERYFVVPLMQSEFVKLRGRSLDHLKNKVTGQGEREDLVAARRGVGLEEWIEDQYRHLNAFETLMKGRYDQIPVERTKRQISDEEIKLKSEFLLRLWRANYPVRTRIPTVRLVN
ncbi:MAG: hypothetical protein AABX49_01690 [Nanoarchaeota archaeon]